MSNILLTWTIQAAISHADQQEYQHVTCCLLAEQQALSPLCRHRAACEAAKAFMKTERGRWRVGHYLLVHITENISSRDTIGVIGTTMTKFTHDKLLLGRASASCKLQAVHEQQAVMARGSCKSYLRQSSMSCRSAWLLLKLESRGLHVTGLVLLECSHLVRDALSSTAWPVCQLRELDHAGSPEQHHFWQGETLTSQLLA